MKQMILLALAALTLMLVGCARDEAKTQDEDLAPLCLPPVGKVSVNGETADVRSTFAVVSPGGNVETSYRLTASIDTREIVRVDLNGGVMGKHIDLARPVLPMTGKQFSFEAAFEERGLSFGMNVVDGKCKSYLGNKKSDNASVFAAGKMSASLGGDKGFTLKLYGRLTDGTLFGMHVHVPQGGE